MSIREESPGRTGRFQGFAEPLAGNVLHSAVCPAGQGLGREEQREGGWRGDACGHALLEVVASPCSLQQRDMGATGPGAGDSEGSRPQAGRRAGALCRQGPAQQQEVMTAALVCSPGPQSRLRAQMGTSRVTVHWCVWGHVGEFTQRERDVFPKSWGLPWSLPLAQPSPAHSPVCAAPCPLFPFLGISECRDLVSCVCFTQAGRGTLGHRDRRGPCASEPFHLQTLAA